MSQRRTLDMPIEQVTRLINEIKTKGGSIWNTEDENYNNRFNVMSSWKEISTSMNLPEETIRVKWKNLRDLFKREAKRFNAQTIDDYQGKWRYFRKMWFIHRPEDYGVKDNESLCRDMNGNCDNIFNDEFDVTSENFVKFEPADRCETEVYIDDPIDPLPDKRRRYDDDDDYDVMFLKSLTPYFRQLEPLRKLAIRNLVQDILMKEIVAQTAANTNTQSSKSEN